MNILLDTHIFLWLASDVEKVSEKHMRSIMDTGNTLYLSSISIAEIMIKKSIGRLDFDADLLPLLDEMGIDVLAFDAASALMLGSLPFHHRDPFDRMILSQAMTKQYKIISVDGKFALYDCMLL